MSGRTSVETVLERFITNLGAICEELKGDTHSRQNEYNDTTEFWSNLIGAAKAVSHEATKLCMMFSKEPLPTPAACLAFADGLEHACVVLLMAFFSFPRSKGKTLRRDLQISIFSLFQAAKDLCFDAKQNRSNLLQLIGTVWSKCEAIEKLPRDNKSAVLSIFQEQLATVQDALSEIQENMNPEHDEEPDELPPVAPNGLTVQAGTWSDADHQLLPPCLGLIKTVKASIKKIKSSISNHGLEEDGDIIAQLDDISEICKSSSSLVDDFVLSLYPPMNHSVVKDQAFTLVEHTRKLISVAQNSQFCSSADEEWIAFLRTAVSHNWEKITDRVLED